MRANPVESPEALDRLAGTTLASEPFFLAARVSGQGSGAANRRLAELGLKVRHYSVLALACSDVHPTQRELSHYLLLDPSQIVALIDELQALGAVQREPDPRDRRSKMVVATAAGRALYRRAKKVVDAASSDSLSALTTEQREDFLALLRLAAFG
ncbi:MAG TPA: winged helix-turn-helix transcriptional regulator [Propionibacterium sp.]|nr:winged helix-turn-helix transcriptional regulator [Propionibacterium sp.]